MSADDALQRAYEAGWNAAMAYRDGLERLALALRSLALDDSAPSEGGSATGAPRPGRPRLRIIDSSALETGFAD